MAPAVFQIILALLQLEPALVEFINIQKAKERLTPEQMDALQAAADNAIKDLANAIKP